MKLIGLASVLALSSLACQRKEEAIPPKAPAPAAATPASSAAPAADEKKEEAAEAKPSKASDRPESAEKKPPVAEPVADKPGFVKSPFSGSIIDVRGIPAGRLVADPMFELSEKKYFRVPTIGPEQEAAVNKALEEETAAAEAALKNLPEAKPVPGKPGYFFSPYDNKIIDATGFQPGALVPDPGAPQDAPRSFRLPAGEAPAEVK